MPQPPRSAGLPLLTAFILPLLLPTASPAAEAVVDLTPRVAPNDLARLTIELEVGGTIRVPQRSDGRDNAAEPGPGDTGAAPRELPISVAAAIEYDEHRVASASGRVATRAIRWYDKVDATLKVDASGVTPQPA